MKVGETTWVPRAKYHDGRPAPANDDPQLHGQIGQARRPIPLQPGRPDSSARSK